MVKFGYNKWFLSNKKSGVFPFRWNKQIIILTFDFFIFWGKRQGNINRLSISDKYSLCYIYKIWPPNQLRPCIYECSLGQVFKSRTEEKMGIFDTFGCHQIVALTYAWILAVSNKGSRASAKKGTATKSFLFCLMHFLSTVMRGNVSFAKAGKLSLIRSLLPCTMGWNRLCRSILTFDEASMISRDFFLNVALG